MPLQGPDEAYRDGFLKLARLDDHAFRELVAVLRSSRASKFFPTDIYVLAKHIKRTAQGDLGDIVFAIVGSSIGASSTGETAQELAENIVAALREDSINLSERELRTFHKRATALFKISSI